MDGNIPNQGGNPRHCGQRPTVAWCMAINVRNSQHLFTVQHGTIRNRKRSPNACTHVTFVSDLLLTLNGYAGMLLLLTTQVNVWKACASNSQTSLPRCSSNALYKYFLSTGSCGPSFQHNFACLSTCPTKGQSAEAESVQFS